MNLFNDEILNEFCAFRDANTNFNWWKYVNIKADLPTALAFARFFCPDITFIDDCVILTDKYDDELYKSWSKECTNSTDVEKMMNLYELCDFFHINSKDPSDEELIALCNTLDFFWSMCFQKRYPQLDIQVEVFKEYDGQLFITVYKKR